jgi:hypothetical protein
VPQEEYTARWLTQVSECIKGLGEIWTEKHDNKVWGRRCMWKHCIIQAKPSVKMTPEQQESARR